MEPTDEWWQAQLLKKLKRMRYQDEEATERLVDEYEDRHRHDGRESETPTDPPRNDASDVFGGNPAMPDQGQATGYDGYIG